MGAYALARMEFRGKGLVFGAIVATLLVPPVIFLIPNYLIVDRLGWLDTLWAVSVPGAAGAFGIFFLRQFFVGLPKEIEEAARIDGAGDLRIFLQIILPLSRPAIATLAVLSFLANWNDFLWPVYVLLSPEKLTLQPGLSVLQGAYSTHFGIVMAGAVIASDPGPDPLHPRAAPDRRERGQLRAQGLAGASYPPAGRLPGRRGRDGAPLPVRLRWGIGCESAGSGVVVLLHGVCHRPGLPGPGCAAGGRTRSTPTRPTARRPTSSSRPRATGRRGRCPPPTPSRPCPPGRSPGRPGRRTCPPPLRGATSCTS